MVVKFVGWNKTDKNPHGAVVNVLDDRDTNDMAMKEILVGSGFPLNFSDDALEEAHRLPGYDQFSRDRQSKRLAGYPDLYH